MKVLLVDDSKTVISIYTKLLRESGYEVVSAGSAQEAFELAVQERPQIGIIDYFMEDRNGDQLIRQMQQDPRTREVVCAIFSQHPDVVDKALTSGAIDLISKEDSNELFLLRVNAMRRLVVIWSRQREIAELVMSESLRDDPFRILFVDDSPTVREVYYNLLTHQGYEVILAEDKASAMRSALQLKPQLAILDYYLPDGTGAELARELRKTSGMEDALIWIYTSRTDMDGMQGDNVDVLYKEDSDDVLIHRLDSIKRYVMAEHSKRLIEAKVLEHQRELNQSSELLEHVERERGFFHQMLDSLPLALVSFKQGQITYTNRSFRNEFALDPQEMSVEQLDQRIGFTGTLQKLVMGQEEKLELNTVLSESGANGLTQHYKLIRTGTFSSDGEIPEILISIENTTEQHYLNELQEQAYLSGLSEMSETVFKESDNSILMLSGDNQNFELRYDQMGSALEEILNMANASVQQVSQSLPTGEPVPLVLKEMQIALENLYTGTEKVRATIRAQKKIVKSAEDPSYQLPEYEFETLIEDAALPLQQQLREHKIEITTHTSGTLDKLRFPRRLLSRLLCDLLEHAMLSILRDESLCYSGGAIHVSIEADREALNQLCIRIEDNGPALDSVQLEALQKMQQEAATETDEGHKLYLTTGLARNYGGSLALETAHTLQGGCAILTIPRTLHLHKSAA